MGRETLEMGSKISPVGWWGEAKTSALLFLLPVVVCISLVEVFRWVAGQTSFNIWDWDPALKLETRKKKHHADFCCPTFGGQAQSRSVQWWRCRGSQMGFRTHLMDRHPHARIPRVAQS